MGPLRLLLAALGLIIFLGMHHAEAATYDLGTISPPATNATGAVVGTGAFTDIFTFSVDKAAMIGVSLTPTVIKPTYDISGLAYSLYQGSTLLIGAISAPTQLTYAVATGVTYSLVVTGTATGTSGGSYGGSLSSVPSLVTPVPAALPLLGSGLAGLAGLMARRRRAATPAAA